MLRRFSTRFGRSKKDEVNGVNETDGTTNDTTNGTTNGISSGNSNGISNGTKTIGTSTNGTKAEKLKVDKRQSSFGYAPKKGKKETIDHSASRSDVESSFAQFAQLIHASRRPLPTQSGDGAYLDHKEPSGLLSDVRALGFKDVHTLMDVMKNKATGALQDDKTYLMEKTIQASRDLQLDTL